VGPPSNDVVITYSAVTAPAVQFNIFEIYRTARFVLDSIHMVEDQTGGGAEEFWVTGFIQETFPASSAQASSQHKFGPMFAELDPDGPRTGSLPFAKSFFLGKPDTPEWPRAYIGVISVLEEDDGGSLSDWKAHVATIAEAMVDGEVSQDVRDFLEEQFKDFVGENIGQLIQAGGQLAETILLLISETVLGLIGMVVAAATLVIAGIISGMEDEYYGTEAFVFVLPTNITDFVHGLPGQAVGKGYQLDTETLTFKGSTSYPEATAFDGIVEVSFHWEFFDKGQS
jgi:hypothetical protein